jgi:glycosyltransferase involved in cell wall biosynthesis
MTVVIGTGRPGPGLARCIEHVRRATTAYPTEILVASGTPWTDAPSDVRVITTPSTSRGDRFDAASERARGKYIAFVDAWIRVPPGWQEAAVAALQDDGVAVVGGPVVHPAGLPVRMRAAAVVLHSRLGIGPRRYLFSRGTRRRVKEMPTFNLVVKSDAFRRVGGFQSPTRHGDGSRLCYKIRSLIGREVVYDPALAVEGSPPPIGRPFLDLVVRQGRHRGDMARRMPETSPLMPWAVPGLALWIAAVLLALAVFLPAARLALLAVIGLYLGAGLVIAAGAGDLRAGLLAGLVLPLVHAAFGLGFWLGYLGSSASEKSPRHEPIRRLKVVVFNWRDITHPWAGGAEAYLHEMMRRWVVQGCDVTWVCERRGNASRVEVIDGIHVHRVGGSRTVYARAALHYLVRLRKHCDVIVDCENGIPFFTPVYARKPVVLLVHHVHQEVFRQELPKHLRWLALWLEGSFMPLVYRDRPVVAVSKSTREALGNHQFDLDRVEVVTCGVELPTPYTGPRNASPTLVCLGRLKPYKGVAHLIEAMPAVLAKAPGARLEIVGQGPDRGRLERLTWRLGLAGNIRFHGYLSSEARDRLLNRSWILVCPSAFEGWGIVCLEASARGLPVVAADVPGLKDSVVDGSTGVLFPFGDRDALAEAITTLIVRPRCRSQMGQAGREWARDHDWDVSAAAFLEIVSRQVAGTEMDGSAGPGADETLDGAQFESVSVGE